MSVETGEEKNVKKQITVLTLSAMLFALCGSADAQQTGKILRIGFLDEGTASGSAVLVKAFQQELSRAWMDRGKNTPSSTGFQRRNMRLPELAARPGSS